jgi:hypothetical protein
VRRHLALLAALAASCGDGFRSAGEPELPPSSEVVVSFPPGATADEVLMAVDGRPGKGEGLSTRGHGEVYFILLRDGARHRNGYRHEAFTAAIGAGVTLPEGGLLVRRVWANSGLVDGTNEELERYSVSVAVEPGAETPYSGKIQAAAIAFAEALARRRPIHPDCVVAMEEVPYTGKHGAGPAERELAEAVRRQIPVPAADGAVLIRSGENEVRVEVERRRTEAAIAVGMMLRKRFDGDARGMLFEYPHARTHAFWMKNCPIPIDLAYIGRGRIEQICTM